ncbi:MAG TPA: NADH-ubiquinone oxidoreductase-F iron-sulfur binding region domain-containing protein [Solirubrobacteraceae bacterium]|jgi:NADH:ubiquinone oxidoreductase subunit F (NADH-binding)
MSPPHGDTAVLDPTVLPRLLAGMPAHGAIGLAEHRARNGELPYSTRRERRGAGALVELVEQAGLRGRGGAAFPLARKLRAVAAAGGRTPLGRRPIVLANAAEGEPASGKDRLLLESLPHLVLDGGVLAARAVGAEELIVCVDEAAGAALESVARALRERERVGRDALTIAIQAVPEGYVSGQESALVNLCNGGPAKPTLTPPMPFQRGVRRRPTLVNNAETLAQLALVARHGPRWFRALGTSADPGSALVTLSGAVAHPGVYEIEYGAPLAALIEAAGGSSAAPRAVLLGGYGGAWVAAGAIPELALANEQLAARGASLGPGVVVLLSERACPVAETARVTRWLASQSAGQCGPCVHGLDAIAGAIEEVAEGAAPAGVGKRIARWCTLAKGRGACRHPDGAVRFITSGLEVFAEEFADHARHGRCDECASAPELPLPSRVELAAAA